MKISLLNYFMLDYHLIAMEEILDQPIFLNPHTKLDFKHPTQKYFRQIYHY